VTKNVGTPVAGFAGALAAGARIGDETVGWLGGDQPKRLAASEMAPTKIRLGILSLTPLFRLSGREA
jgi:hypothetical protein